jgi:uncharacterized protein (DUF362 family)
VQARVSARRVAAYDEDAIYRALPDEAFALISRGDRVVLKPNWVLHAHKQRPRDWDYVVTHPTVITAVLRKTLDRLDGDGEVIITDAPETDCAFQTLIAHYPVGRWRETAQKCGVRFEVIDLRDAEWETRNEIVVRRHSLRGDPRGKTEVDLEGDASEFFTHRRSPRGYYGADYDQAETNRAHDGVHNRYRVSRTVLEADVFINLPKLKTHRKAGITSCLKNLVGINTHKNFLPHHSEGGPGDGGDQFPADTARTRVEGSMMGFLRKRVLRHALLARVLHPLNTVGRSVFGDTRDVVRSGNWYGNDTVWRMILDLNKVLAYANPDGTLRADAPASRKRYIGVVDAIRAGDGNGPLSPDPVDMRYLVCGTSAVATDAACATLMGFEAALIPAIARSLEVHRYRTCDFTLADVRVDLARRDYALADLPPSAIVPCEPHFGWKGHIERPPHTRAAS